MNFSRKLLRMNNLGKVIKLSNINNIKKSFPILNKNIDGKKIIYLDSAASSQKPQKVIDAITHTYENNYANVHRGIYKLSQIATEKYEASRKKNSKIY